MAVSPEVRFRNNFGRFIGVCDEAGARAAQELVEATADIASDLAPVGPGRADYGRRPKLSGAIFPVMMSAKVGRVVARAGHALAQEYGAGPHWIPNAFGFGITVLHPGNGPQPYLRPAIRAVQPLVPGILERAYPG